ncbi:2-dehydro-3-deoxygalactonokinase [Flavilitoribacter nigricans]|uniref:2-keto-3-deoxy-galactonokinase n=1 Tax=Flavilitoribacter nigricans (strain ATCC 23147 / DSM 23189 / NBRC 102662 / NCIMB 1420 / SS-2) TaxID=1122177 RepID=A0A2D0NEZ3_FLAN2|nr:2-dehydro-3-deoxygalactonokinase [Flavilitoribacter nigricans]PHN07081.1 2-keto-3-deoxy-galactonokinase [Flavilitoribacter nigricans DSM 23189 = NBRC 102662]
MIATDYLISCDWGTSSFRLYLVRVSDGKILHLVDNGLGIKEMYTNWSKPGNPARLEYFLEYLDFRIYLLSKKAGRKLDGIPVLISGMASSSIGMLELPYSQLPFPLSGRKLEYTIIEPDATQRPPIYLWSGLCSEHDVMRGEESQIIGLSDRFASRAGVAILPGTHSKHIFLEGETIVDFHTYMTGEFFALLSSHSILKNSLPEGKVPPADPVYFAKGVRAAKELSLLTTSFHVRTNELLHQLGPEQNFHYLSGLLIGSELRELPTGVPVYLCGGGRLRVPYERALEILGIRQVEVIGADEVEGAVARAHALFWRNL